MSFKLRKKATAWTLKQNHRISTYFEVVEAVYDGEYFNVECEQQHTRNALCRKRHGYHEVVEEAPQPAPQPAATPAPKAVNSSKLTVSSLESRLSTGEFDDGLPALLLSEESGKNRKTAREAIQDRIDSIGA